VPADESANRKLTGDWMSRLKPYGRGAYGNEGDVMDADFGESFWGTNYPWLLQIKRQVDPHDVFWAPTAAGSERWFGIGLPEFCSLINAFVATS
jgi:hypothetical protein